MPKAKDLVNLFRAIGAHDLSRASDISRKLAAEHGARGQRRMERDLLGALNGAAKKEIPSATQLTRNAWLAPMALMPISNAKSLDEIELPISNRKSLEEVVREWRFKEKLQNAGLPRRWRLLFHGPPGCGKSASAAALAKEMALPCYLVRFDSLIGAYLGQTAMRLREVFNFAEQNPSVLIFDEVDALAKRRGSPTEVGELDRIVIAFMQELEHARGEGMVIATSNIPGVLDSALWRRFDIHINFPRPSSAALKKFAARRASQFGFKARRDLIQRCLRSNSFAEAEQLIIGEVRRELLKD